MNERISVFTSDQISVWCDVGKQLIEHQIHKPTSGAPFRGALTAGVESMRTHGCTKWLSDDRLNGPLSAEDFAWAEETWSKSAVSAGWRSWALILPKEAMGATELQKHAKLYRSRGVVVLTFLTPEAGHQWLATRS